MNLYFALLGLQASCSLASRFDINTFQKLFFEIPPFKRLKIKYPRYFEAI